MHLNHVDRQVAHPRFPETFPVDGAVAILEPCCRCSVSLTGADRDSGRGKGSESKASEAMGKSTMGTYVVWEPHAVEAARG